jgi:hypothetical protein
MLDALEKYGNKHPFIALIFGFVLVAFLGLSDYLTGSEMSFSIFYLIPITLLTVMAGRFIGLVVSVISAGVWLTADLTAGHVYTQTLIPHWNAIVRLGYNVLPSSIEPIIKRVDELMYSVKNSGKNNLKHETWPPEI